MLTLLEVHLNLAFRANVAGLLAEVAVGLGRDGGLFRIAGRTIEADAWTLVLAIALRPPCDI